MKKNRLIIFIMAMVLGVFFVIPVRASAGEFDNYWDGSTSAKSYYDFDGKGVRFFVSEIYGNEATGEIYYVMMMPLKEYYFDDYNYEAGYLYLFGRNYLESYLLNYPLKRALQDWGSASVLPEWERIYVYFEPWNNYFAFEFQGSDLEYAVFCIEEYYYNGWGVGYDYGYDYGYDVGYDDGHYDGWGEGYAEGYEAASVDNGFYEGYQAGYNDGFDEALEEINAVERVIPSAIGSIWLVVRDFLSIEILGIAIWEVIGALVAIGLGILLIRLFL